MPKLKYAGEENVDVKSIEAIIIAKPTKLTATINTHKDDDLFGEGWPPLDAYKGCRWLKGVTSL